MATLPRDITPIVKVSTAIATTLVGFGSTLGLGWLAAVAQTVPIEPAPLVGDGVYFYGEAPTPEQLGSTYLVFEAQGDRVVGAIFMPFSSFDCFQGAIAGGQLAMDITNSYDQVTHPYAIGLAPGDPVANAHGQPAPLALQGFYNLGRPREADLALLRTCQGDIPVPALPTPEI